MAILEINERFTCTDCGYAWGGMLGDDEIPLHCECDKSVLKPGTMQYEITERVTLLTVTYINADSLEMAIGIARDQGAIEYDKLVECENHEIVCAREIGKGT